MWFITIEMYILWRWTKLSGAHAGSLAPISPPKIISIDQQTNDNSTDDDENNEQKEKVARWRGHE